MGHVDFDGLERMAAGFASTMADRVVMRVACHNDLSVRSLAFATADPCSVMSYHLTT